VSGVTVVLPQDYHARGALEKNRIQCITQDNALREDIRALRIGILNIMPRAETYEYSLLHPLGRSVLQIEPIFIRLKTHAYTSTSHDHLEHLYRPFEDVVRNSHLDGLILTGAPVEDLDFSEVSYFDEVRRILRYARDNVPSTLGLCWGGLAMARFIGIDKIITPKKIFGVFQARNLDRNHRITGEMDDLFWCPLSSHSIIPDSVMEKERDKGTINLLARSEEAGYVVFESSDRRFLMHLGHPEYEPQRLIEEYRRDMKAGRTDVEPPVNVDPAAPVNIWRGHRTEFFSQWIKYVHETTSF
jgi:homoserine O-succinyltransferase